MPTQEQYHAAPGYVQLLIEAEDSLEMRIHFAYRHEPRDEVLVRSYGEWARAYLRDARLELAEWLHDQGITGEQIRRALSRARPVSN